MGLRQQAESDLALILEDESGFAVNIKLTNPAGVIENLTGFSGDISSVIDPQTGVAVIGQLAHVALRNSTVIAAFGELPKAISKESEKAWVVQFDDLQGAEHKFKIVQSAPDKTLGMSTYVLEYTK